MICLPVWLLLFISGSNGFVTDQPLPAVPANPNAQYVLDNYFDINSRLLDDLLKNYKRTLPALYLSDRNGLPRRQLLVNITLNDCSLIIIDQMKQTVSMRLELSYEWTDPRLAWNVSRYDGIQSTTVAKKETVWVPDIVPYDSSFFGDVLTEEMQYVKMFHTGYAFFYNPFIVEFSCIFELSNYPFDTQTCDLFLGSYSFPQDVMNTVGVVGTIKLDDASNGEWTILKIEAEGGNYVGGYSQNYSVTTYRFVMKRSTTYYIILMIIPSFILTILCVIGLLWEDVSAENYIENVGLTKKRESTVLQLNLGFAAILAMMFVLQMATQDMPKINDTDSLSVYLLVNLGLITVASVLVLIMGKYRKRMKTKESKTVSTNVVRNFLLKWLHLLLMSVFLAAAVINFCLLIL